MDWNAFLWIMYISLQLILALALSEYFFGEKK